MRLSLAFVCLLFLFAPVRAQDSRAAIIEAQRDQKAQQPAPQPLPHYVDVLASKHFIGRIARQSEGWRLRMGGLYSGSGFAAGPEYFRSFRQNRVIVRASAVGTLGRSYLVDAAFGLPRLASDRAFLDFLAVRRGLTSVPYYGPGARSAKTGRTNYLLEDVWLNLQGGVRPSQRTRVGGLARYGRINTGPGRDSSFASAERVYTEAQAPGITRQSNYAVAGAFADYDWRDSPGLPRRGGYYLAEFSSWYDQKLGLGTFDRLDVDVQHYIPFLNDQRVIALRARGSFTDPRSGQFVPFYLQPTLGGANDLRGFRAFRFYDNNAVVFNGEYRWALFTGLDMALFADAGKVFPRWQSVSLRKLEASFGFGFRANLRESPFLRIDTGFSHEGFQVWIKFVGIS